MAFPSYLFLFLTVACFLFLYILRWLCRNEYAGFLFFVFMKCCFLSCLHTEFHLRVNLGFASFIRLHISSIRLQDMSFYIILKLQIKYVLQFFLNLLIFHRENNLYPAVKVTRHPVGTGKIELLLAAVGKPEDTAVLQLTAYNTADRNIIADAFDACAQAADLSLIHISEPTRRS